MLSPNNFYDSCFFDFCENFSGEDSPVSMSYTIPDTFTSLLIIMSSAITFIIC